MIQAGDLVNAISIQQLVPGSPQQDSGGAPDEDWATLYTTFAKISPLRGRELLAAQQTASEVTGTMQLRYRTDYTITPKMRVLFGARIYDILAVVVPDELKREVMLYVREGPNAG